MIQFSSHQKEAIRKGAQKRKGLIREAEKAANRALGKGREEYLDTILSGTTGIGKTHNIIRSIEDTGLPYQVMQGNISMFAFGGNLMVLHSQIPESQKMVLIIDDCDSFFENKENINILKGMTGKSGSRNFRYSKKINEHMFTDLQNSLMSQYQIEGQHGFTIPTDNFVFVFTTNFQLPYEDDAKESILKNGPTAKSNRLSDLAAIRGRFNTKDYVLDFETNWGWLVEVAIHDNGLGMLSDIQQLVLLDWVWNNWHNMTETNIRTIEKMAYEMIDYPNEYRDNWEADFLK